MEPIGGYFSLELPHFDEYHKDAIKLNTGRNCLDCEKKMIENKIFVARLWTSMLEYIIKEDIDYLLAFQMEPLLRKC